MGDLEIGFIPRWICLAYWFAYLFLFFLFLIIIKKRKRHYGDNLKNGLFIACVLIFFALFYCLETDFFNYFRILTHPEWFEGTGEIDESTLWLARQLGDGNFILFRFIIWGSAVILILLFCEISNISKAYTIYFLLILYYNIFCYGRVSLAISLFFLGTTIILVGGTKSKKIIGCLLILTSILVHRSMGIPIACLISLIFPITQKSELRFSVFFILIGGIFAYLVLSGGVFSQGSEMAGRINSYNNQIAEGEWAGANIVGLMMRTLQYILFYYVFIILRSLIYKCHIKDKWVLGIYRITWMLILFASAFLIAMGYTPYFYRVVNITMIPICALLAYMMRYNLIRKNQYLAIMSLAFLYHNLKFYSIYIHCV